MPENGTLTVDSDVTEPITISKPIKVAGNGKSVDAIVVQDAEVTIDDVVASSVTVTGTKDFTLTNSTIKGGQDNLAISTSGKVTLTGNKFEDGE